MDAAHDALLRPARANSCALTLAQTMQPLHHDVQAVHRAQEGRR